ncbi:hypothetical protein AMTRI_Chr07g79270 [Amborella trichopoda]
MINSLSYSLSLLNQNFIISFLPGFLCLPYLSLFPAHSEKPKGRSLSLCLLLTSRSLSHSFPCSLRKTQRPKTQRLLARSLVWHPHPVSVVPLLLKNTPKATCSLSTSRLLDPWLASQLHSKGTLSLSLYLT